MKGNENMNAPNLDLFNLTGKKALVTGGAVGIGKACACVQLFLIGSEDPPC